jgi:hypothetical protein
MTKMSIEASTKGKLAKIDFEDERVIEAARVLIGVTQMIERRTKTDVGPVTVDLQMKHAVSGETVRWEVSVRRKAD